MVPRLITHTVDDQPQVLIVSDTPALTKLLAAFWQRHGVDVVVAEPKDSGANMSENWYRQIIVIFNSPLPQLTLAENVPTLVVTSTQLQLDVTKLLSENKTQSGLLLFENAVTKQSWPDWLSELTSQIVQHKILGSDQKVALTMPSQQELDWKNILLANWKSKKWLVTTKKQAKISDIAQEICSQIESYYGVFPTVQASEQLTIPSFDQDVDEVFKAKPVELSENLKYFVRSLSSVPSTPSVPSSKTSDLPKPKLETKQVEDDPQPEAVQAPSVLTIPKHTPPKVLPQHTSERIQSPVANQTPQKQVFDSASNHSEDTVFPPDKSASRLDASTAIQKENTVTKEDTDVNLITTTKKVENTQKIESEKDAIQRKESEIEKELIGLFHENRVQNKVKKTRDLAQQTLKIVKKNKRKQSFFFLGVLSFGALAGIGVMTLVFWLTQMMVTKNVIALASAMQTKDQDQVAQASETLLTSVGYLQPQYDAYSSVVPASWLATSETILTITEKLDFIAQEMQLVNDITSLGVGQILGTETGDGLQSMQHAARKSQDLFVTINELQTEIEMSNLNQEEVVDEVVTELSAQAQKMITFQEIQPLLESLLGVEGKKKYVVLFQNEQELRATGGFLQAIALITVDRGVVIDYQVFDIYELERQIRGDITPPAEIAKYLNESAYYLHDANWDADFAAASKDINLFLENILSTQIDGYIAINNHTLSQLVAALGPIDLAAYNEVITDRNLAERMEFHSEVQLVDSSQSKDPYAKVLLNQILSRLQLIPREKVPQMLDNMYASFENKEATIYLANNSLMSSFRSLGWTGELLTPPCPTQLAQAGCDVDTLYVVETNVGVNRANYQLSRTVKHHIELDAESATHRHSISFKNRANSNSWPQGAYSSYIRVYIPQGAKVSQVVVDGTSLNPRDISLKNAYQQYQEIGFTVQVPIQSTKQVEVVYSTPVSLTSGAAYTFFNQKQPGTGETPMTVTMSLAEDLEPKLIAPQAEVTGSTITFSKVVSDHFFAGVQVE